MNIPQFWLMQDNLPPSGPYELAQLQLQYQQGQLPVTAFLCQVGQTQWLPIGIHPTFQQNLPVISPVNSVEQPAITQSLSQNGPLLESTVKREPIPNDSDISSTHPWNPWLIHWFSLIFTPFWGSIMAILNASRIPGLVRPWITLWLTILATAIGIFGDLSFSQLFYLYLATWGVVWYSGLRKQSRIYPSMVARAPNATSHSSWTLPTIVGIPFAGMVLLVFGILPFLPLTQREVCERLIAEDTLEKCKDYVTPHFYRVLQKLETFKSENDEHDQLILTSEMWAPADIGGYLVHFEGTMAMEGSQHRIRGGFHLLQFGSDWKIDEIYCSEIDEQPLPQLYCFSQILNDANPNLVPPAQKFDTNGLPKIPPVAKPDSSKRYHFATQIQIRRFRIPLVIDLPEWLVTQISSAIVPIIAVLISIYFLAVIVELCIRKHPEQDSSVDSTAELPKSD
jgi:hypothetical protein